MGAKANLQRVDLPAVYQTVLLERLKKYGLNPTEWALDFSRSASALEVSDKKLEFIRDIQIVSRYGEGAIFIGGAYVKKEEASILADWMELATAEDCFN